MMRNDGVKNIKMSNLYEYATYNQPADINVTSAFGKLVHAITRKAFSMHKIIK